MFATSLDELPAMYEGRKDYRYLVTTGTLVTAAVIVGQLQSAGVDTDVADEASGRYDVDASAILAQTCADER